MARPKIHENPAKRQEAYTLRRRLSTLNDFCSRTVIRAYERRGLDVSNQLKLPALAFDELRRVAGIWLIENQFLQELAVSSPFIEVDRSGKNPTVLLRSSPKPKPSAPSQHWKMILGMSDSELVQFVYGLETLDPIQSDLKDIDLELAELYEKRNGREHLLNKDELVKLAELLAAKDRYFTVLVAISQYEAVGAAS